MTKTIKLTVSDDEFEEIKTWACGVPIAALVKRELILVVRRPHGYPVRVPEETKETAFGLAQRNAHAAVSRSIADGALVRPGVCSVCGCACKPYAHHDDYRRPLDVRWLCGPCHRQHHAEHGKAPA